jgi:glycosyltransferase involved in cell wall biosynthesis
MRTAIVWPKPRAHRWQLGRLQPSEYPDLSDGLLFLETHGVGVSIESSCPKWLNPLIDYHEFYSGLDPVRAARVAWHARRYDVIICIGDATAYFFLKLKRLFGLRVPVVLIDPALGDGYPRRKRLQDWVLPRVERVVVYGGVQIEYLRREYGERVRPIFLHHRADTEFYSPAASPASAEPPLVYSVGHDISRDFDTFAKAASIARARGLDARFVVQTSRAVADEARALEIRRDYVSYASLRDTYRAAAVVVVPLTNSRHAGGINALLEAMASGAPLVTSTSEGIRDYVVDGVTARLVPPGDAGALADAIEQLLSDRAGANAMAQRARRFVVDACANPVYAAHMAELLREVVAER